MSFFVLYQQQVGADVTLSEHADRDAVVAKLKELALDAEPGDRTLVFEGRRLHITTGPFRYLQDADQFVPLFEPPAPGPIDVEGSLAFVDERPADDMVCQGDPDEVIEEEGDDLPPMDLEAEG